MYLTFENQTLHFIRQLQPNNVAEFLLNANRKFEYNYLKCEVEKGTFKISCLPVKKIPELDSRGDDPYTSTLRRSHRPVALLAKLTDEFSNSELDEFVKRLNILVNPPDTVFEIVSGDRLLDIYHYSNYMADVTGGSTLHKSCMRYDESQPFLNLYVENGIQSVVGLKAGKVVSRALLWENVEVLDKFKPSGQKAISLLDRTYATSTDEELLLKQWAESHADFIKIHGKGKYQPKDSKTLVPLHLQVRLRNPAKKPVPYLDTFKFTYNEQNTILGNISPSPHKYISFTDPHGGWTTTAAMKRLDFIIPYDENTDCIMCPEIGVSVSPEYLKLNIHDYRLKATEFPCKECNSITNTGNLIWVNGHPYCRNHKELVVADAHICTKHSQKLPCRFCEVMNAKPTTTIGICGECGVHAQIVRLIYGGQRCMPCATNNGYVFTCETCLSVVASSIEDLYLLADNQRVCGTCYNAACANDNLYTCSSCGIETDNDDGSVFNGDWLCHDCSSEVGCCILCDNEDWFDNLFTVEDENLCEDCFTRHTSVCDNCGNHMFTESLVHRENEDGAEVLVCAHHEDI